MQTKELSCSFYMNLLLSSLLLLSSFSAQHAEREVSQWMKSLIPLCHLQSSLEVS